MGGHGGMWAGPTCGPLLDMASIMPLNCCQGLPGAGARAGALTAASSANPLGKSGRSARSMRRPASTSCSLAAPSRLL